MSVLLFLAASLSLSTTAVADTAPAPVTAIRLVDVAAERGLAFRHDLGRPLAWYAVDTTGSGACVLDADGDGDDDVFLVNGGFLPVPGREEKAPPRSPNRLFRNDGGRFEDVTDASGLAGPPGAWGMGCAAADVDGDADLDLFVSAWGPDQLYLNDGSGRFREVGASAGLADDRWTTSCGFADHDADGDLDLYVGAYVDQPADGKRCRAHDIGVTCGPRDYPGVRGRLYRNDGVAEDGVPRFTDVTEASRAIEPAGKTLGVLFEDLSGDDRPDLYIANDTMRNTLLVNLGDGTFKDRTMLAGVGYSDTGVPLAGMGVDAGDVDGDGALDMMVTNFHLETNTLYRGRADMRWADATDASGLGASSLSHLAFGINAVDLDLDGDLDIFIGNGHVEPNVDVFDATTSHAQADQVLENQSAGGRVSLVDVGKTAIEAPAVVSRGTAVLDLEGDGDLDLVVNANGGPAVLLENRTERAGAHWLALSLRGPAPNTRGIGARVTVVTPRGAQQRRARTASSFLSTSTDRLHFGLGPATEARATVTWPDGTVQELGLLPGDRVHVIAHPALTTPAPSAPALDEAPP